MEKIKKLKKEELLELLQVTVDKIDLINDFTNEVEQKRANLNTPYEEVVKEGGLLSKINKAKEDIDEKLKLILDSYNKICEGDEKNDSIKDQLEELLDYYQKSKDKITNFRIEIFGGEIENENGKIEKIPGLQNQINEFYKKQKEKYDVLYQKIEEELKGGATTINLTKAFADKVDEYKKSSENWSRLLILLLLMMSVYFGVLNWNMSGIETLTEAFKNIVYRAPFLAFVIWLGIFLGNRRAESKKLEESYKHKEVMARSFIGYKKMLETIDDEDEGLLRQHMNNLLIAIGKDSSLFLDTKGEDYPLFSFLGLKKEDESEEESE
ncbi:hypothetical protein KJ671_04120 [Patescibacteria group bacterium]|nr:hypothetical protein [Patescibacteria group bacterium]